MSLFLESLSSIVQKEMSNSFTVEIKKSAPKNLEQEKQLYYSRSSFIQITGDEVNILLSIYSSFAKSNEVQKTEEVLNQICGRLKNFLENRGIKNPQSSMPVSPHPYVLPVKDRLEKYGYNQIVEFSGDVSFTLALSCHQRPGQKDGSTSIEKILQEDLSNLLEPIKAVAL